MKMHSCKNLVLCYYLKYFILFFPKKLIRPREKYKFHSTTLAILKNNAKYNLISKKL